jgi:RNA polymerase sigma-70 factor (ECF subfamily)
VNLKIEEIALIDECRNGNQMAQKLLYDRYAEQMMIVCYRYISNREEAQEAMLDGFYDFFKNIGSFSYRGEGSAKAWLKKLVVNRCLATIRKKRPVYAEAERLEDELRDNDTVMDRLSAKEIMQMIHTLPDGYRTVFNLYVFEELTHKEIAGMLGITENTSKSQLHKAKAMLQKKILMNYN